MTISLSSLNGYWMTPFYSENSKPIKNIVQYANAQTLSKQKNKIINRDNKLKQLILIIRRSYMNKFIVSTLATVMCVSTFSVIAATTVENTDDGSAIGSSESPQIKEQDKRIDKKATNKSLKRNGTMSHNDKEMKAMDTDSNGMVSKDEYILYHEKMYDKMKQKNGGVSYKNSMNNKPMGTTTGESQNGSVDITKKDGPINGTTTGTNQ